MYLNKTTTCISDHKGCYKGTINKTIQGMIKEPI